MSIKLSLLRLAEFLLCELEGSGRGKTFGGWPITTHPGSWLPLSRVRGLGELDSWLLEAPQQPPPRSLSPQKQVCSQ